MNIEDKMSLTIDLAGKALKQGEMPISAYVFLDDEVVSKAYTSEIADKKLLVHAELKALLAADDQKFSIAERKKMQLFTTLEPCMMCYGTAMSSFIGEIYFSLKAPEDGITALFSFNNFSGSFIKRQIPKMQGNILVYRTKKLFCEYVKNVNNKAYSDFATEVIKNN